MCKYCEECVSIPNMKYGVSMYISKAKIKIQYDTDDGWDTYTTYTDIKYCPFCGRKLK